MREKKWRKVNAMCPLLEKENFDWGYENKRKYSQAHNIN